VSPWTINALSFVLGLVFGAGMLFAMIKEMRRDLNGLGGRAQRFERNTILVLMTVTDKREDRELLATMLRQL
jgi:hypothetical protein